MQHHPIVAPYVSLRAHFRAGAGLLSSAAILLAWTAACSNAAPAATHSLDTVESVGSNAAESKYVVGYLPNYRGALSDWTRTLDFSALTHVNLAFATVEQEANGLAIHYRADGASSGEEPGLAAFVAEAHAASVKVCLAVGGGVQSDDLGKMILEAPTELAKKIALYAQEHELDCIDVDQEEQYPTAALDAAYGEFIRDLGRRLHDMQKQLTAAVASWNPAKILPVVNQFDFLNVMAYDLNNPPSSKTPIQGSTIADAQKELDYWVANGAPKSKLVWGVPFYGFEWNGEVVNYVTYASIVQALGSVPTQDQVQVQNSTITLNSSATIRSKAELAQQSYGGLMIWELGQDATNEQSLLGVIKSVMR